MASVGGNAESWRFHRVGLIVTGETEALCLPDLFRHLTSQGTCLFTLIGRIGQRSPIESPRRRLKMIGTGKVIPTKDEEQIGAPARRFLREGGDYVLLVDDLEADRAAKVEAVFGRYRLALDTMLPEALRPYVAVHFLVNMLEAYYFADASALNRVLGTELEDFAGDVETIRHPKNDLKSLHPGFDEKEHGVQVVQQLDVAHVLRRKDACASLRTMFTWASEAVGVTDWLSEGRLLDATKEQVEALRQALTGSTV